MVTLYDAQGGQNQNTSSTSSSSQLKKKFGPTVTLYETRCQQLKKVTKIPKLRENNRHSILKLSSVESGIAYWEGLLATFEPKNWWQFLAGWDGVDLGQEGNTHTERLKSKKRSFNTLLLQRPTGVEN